MILKKIISTLTMLVFCFCLSGCNLMKDFDREGEPEFNLGKIDLILDTDANDTSAIAIDLVVIYRPELMKALIKMTAEEYFKSSDQIRRDYPETLRIWHWELTPGQTISNYEIDTRGSYEPFGGIIFARYLTPGMHRVRVGSSESIHVLLKREDLCIVEQGCPDEVLLLPTADPSSRLILEKKTKKEFIKNTQKDLNKVRKSGSFSNTCS